MYLPQYHPINLNDRVWGKGFTEWTNVTKAKPLFEGHYQPHYPADLGYYDLRVPAVREEQARMAADYSIEGFCYYHYWFGSAGYELTRPLKGILNLKKPDFPFCLCWANQTWTGIWHGAEDKILKKQDYPETKIKIFIDSLLEIFEDKRYICVDSKPLLLIFRPFELPKFVIEILRDKANEKGFPGIYILGVLHFEEIYKFNNYKKPFFERLKNMELQNTNPDDYLLDGFVNSVMPLPVDRQARKTRVGPQIIDHEYISDLEIIENPKYENYPMVGNTFDNSPRCERDGNVYINSSPTLFKKQIKKASSVLSSKEKSKQLLFLKSWNEWAEGNHLEPCKEYGFQWLEALKDGLKS